MKSLKFLGLTLTLLLMSVPFVGCTDDVDTNPFVGTWECILSTGDVSIEDQFVFTSDMKVTETYSKSGVAVNYQGTYTYDEKSSSIVLYFFNVRDPDEYHYSFSNSTTLILTMKGDSAGFLYKKIK